LKRDSFIELKISGKTHYWKKAKEWPDTQENVPEPGLFDMKQVRRIDSYDKRNPYG